MHFVEKKYQQFKQQSVQNVLKGLDNLIKQQYVEDARAIHGAGCYELAKTHKRFFVESSRWHSWTEEHREQHLKLFRDFTPGLSDTFTKPKNPGRKSCYFVKQKLPIPEIIEDRHQNVSRFNTGNSNTNTSTTDILIDSFSSKTRPQPTKTAAETLTTPSSTTSASLQQSTPTTTIVCTSHTSTTSASVQASSTLTNTNTTTVQQPILQPSASNSVQPPPSIRFQDPREEDPLIFELYPQGPQH